MPLLVDAQTPDREGGIATADGDSKDANGFFLGVAEDEGIYVVATLSLPMTRRAGRVWISNDLLRDKKAWLTDARRRLGPPAVGGGLAPRLPMAPDALLDARTACGDVLADLSFAGEASVMAVAVTRHYGFARDDRLWRAALLCMFQRLRTRCAGERRLGALFLPAGLPEFAAAFGDARERLSTGSDSGFWPTAGGKARRVRNLPLSMFLDDAVALDPRRYPAMAAAALIAHAALWKREAELGWLPGPFKGTDFGCLYDRLPAAALNAKASRRGPPDGIVRCGGGSTLDMADCATGQRP